MTAIPATALDPTLVRDYVREGASSAYQVVTLTDEEIVAVDGQRSVAPRFWYDAQPPEARRIAVAVASRGLVARGWAMGSQNATDVDSLALEPTGPLRSVLALRKAADRIVLAEQRLEGEVRARVYYLLGDPTRLGVPTSDPLGDPLGDPTGDGDETMVLEEAVNSGGLHRFSTMTRTAATEALAAWCAVGAHLTRAARTGLDETAAGRSLSVDRGSDVETAVRAVVGATRVVTVVATVAGGHTPPDERYLTVYVGDDGLATADGDGSRVRLRGASGSDLMDRIAEMMQ